VDRREPARPLQVHDDQEEHGEIGQALEERCEQRRRDHRDLEQGQIQHRLGLPALDQDEGGEQHDAADQVAGDRGVEGRGGQLGHGPQHSEQPEAEAHHSEQIEMPARPLTPLVQDAHGKQQRGGTDRHIDPEDPAPGDIGDDEPAEHDAQHRAEAPADRVVAVRAAPPFSREEVGDHCPAVRGDKRPADALQHAEADDRCLIPGERARERSENEDGEAHLIHPDPAEHVAKPPHLGGEQRDDEQVADHDPDHRGERDMQRPLDLGQRKNHDRGVDRGDQHAGHHHDHRQARPCGDAAILGGCGCLPSCPRLARHS